MKTKYVIEADSSQDPSVEEFEAEVDRVEWMFDFLVTEPDVCGYVVEEGPVYADPMVYTLTLTYAIRFKKSGDAPEGEVVEVDKALPAFFEVSGKALQAYFDHMEGLAEDAVEMRQEMRYLGR